MQIETHRTHDEPTFKTPTGAIKAYTRTSSYIQTHIQMRKQYVYMYVHTQRSYMQVSCYCNE